MVLTGYEATGFHFAHTAPAKAPLVRTMTYPVYTSVKCSGNGRSGGAGQPFRDPAALIRGGASELVNISV